MAAVTICSDFGAQEKKSLSWFLLFSHLFVMKWWNPMPWSSFSECWVLSQLFHSPLSPSSRGYLILHFLPKGGVICILRLLIFLPAILIPACVSSSPAFLMMYHSQLPLFRHKRSEIWIHATTCVNAENIVLFKKPRHIGYILYDYIYMKCSE